MEIEKGDMIIYDFGFDGLVEAKVVRVYDNHVKVAHKDGWHLIGMGFKHIIRKARVISVSKKNRKK